MKEEWEIFEPNKIGNGIVTAEIYVPAGAGNQWTGYTSKMRIGCYKYEESGSGWMHIFYPATESIQDAQ